MQQQEFFEQIAPYIAEYAPLYDIKAYAAIMAQAALESKYGTSELSIYARNILGIKWHEESSGGGAYIKVATERNPDGTTRQEKAEWGTYSDFKACINGYFQFLFERTGITRYNNLKNITDDEQYIRTIGQDGYYTADVNTYTNSCMTIIKEFNLDKYNPEPAPQPEPQPVPPQPTGYTNSPLVSYVDLTPNFNPRSDAYKYGCTEGNDRLTIHHMAGSYGVETCGKIFHQKSGSSNYGIDPTKIAMFVEEKNRAWTSSNRSNDFRGITIEVANTPEGVANKTWEIAPESYNKLIALCADIAKRNGKTKVIEISDEIAKISYVDPDDRVEKFTAYANSYKVPAGTMLMTQHWYFEKTACPGPYIQKLWKKICADINSVLSGSAPAPIPVPTKPTVAKPLIKKGSTGAEALNLQKDLNYLGFTDERNMKLSEDGIFGTHSVEALRKFQGNKKLVVDGVYGNNSYEAMKKALN